MKKNFAWIFLAVCLIPFLSSCGSEPRPDFLERPERILVWPPEPFTPRIQWIREITSDDLLELKPGFWNRVSRFLFGTERSTLVRTHGIHVTDSGIIFIADPGARAMHVLDTIQGRYTLVKTCGEDPLESPIDMTMDDEGNLYLTDSVKALVCQYKLTDGTLSGGFPILRLERPTGIVFNPRNRLIYVVDTVKHRVIGFDTSGKERVTIGGGGNEPGRFNFPVAITVNSRGEILVVDSLNARIETFTPDGQFLHTFGEPGDVSGYFAKPKGIAVDSEDHIYVVDTLFDAVQVFDQRGRLLMTFGQAGKEIGHFWMPSGIFIDKNDFIYVSDTYNQRIQVFKYLRDPAAGSKDELASGH